MSKHIVVGSGGNPPPVVRAKEGAQPSTPTDYVVPSISQHWMRHEGATAFVVGSGPSMYGFDYARLAGRLTIGLNDAGIWFPCSYHFFADHGIYGRYLRYNYAPETIIVCQHKACTQLEQQKFSHMDKVRQFSLLNVDDPAKSKKADDQLYVQRTVATGGIHLAWKLGCDTVYLLGVDGYKVKPTKEFPEGIYYGDGTLHQSTAKYPSEDLPGDLLRENRHADWDANMRTLRAYFDTIDDAPAVFNLSKLSTISAWPFANLAEVL